MRRIVLTLVMSIIVFVGTIVSTDIYVSQKSTESADYLNDIALDNFRSEMESDILLTEVSIRSFLSGQKHVSVNDSNMIVIDEQNLKEFRKGIHSNLCQFMKANRYYENSMFIIDDEINREYYGEDGFYAPSVNQGDTMLHVLSDNYDYNRSSHYQQLKRERKRFWCTPSPTSPVAGKYMIIYVPIILSDGRFFGAFAVSLDSEMISDKLKKHLPYGDDYSAIFILDEKGRVFSSSHLWIKEHQDEEELKRCICKFTVSDSTTSYIPIRYDGVEYYGYRRTTANAPWIICTFCETDKIYEDADKFKTVVLVTSLLGMLLMLVCCYVISRQVRSNLRKKAAAEEELKMAAKVQMSMLKTTQATLTGGTSLQAFMKPAREAGGDLYDYVEKDGNLIFCIGDVSGKGMAAALFMTQVVSLFRNAVKCTVEPAEIVSMINDVLAESNSDMTFCTFFVGVLDGCNLKFCNAGHNPPVLLSGHSSHFMKVKPNLALGLMEGFPYKTEESPVHEGDTLLLYTDGVTEAKNKEHKEFGENRLIESLSSQSPDVIGRVFDDVCIFVAGYEQSDDITMVCVTV